MNKNLVLLSSAFFFIFLGFSSVQQYLTSYFVDIGYLNAGFYLLLLIYGGFLLGNLFFVGIIKKIGSKASMLLAALFYSLFIFSLLLDNLILFYISSLLAGFAAAFLWVGQQSYIILASKGKNVGKYIGIFNIFLFLGASIGSFAIGKIISGLGYEISFSIFGLFPLIGVLLILFLKDYKEGIIKKEVNKLAIFGYFKNLDLLRIGFFYLSLSFIIGLSYSIVPIHVKESLGVEYVGTVSSLYYFIVVFFSYFLGKIVDKYDNKKLVIVLYILGLFSVISLYFYEYNSAFIFAGISLLGIIYSIVIPLGGSILNKISNKENIKYLSSFFFIFNNIGLVGGILFSLNIKSNLIYSLAFGLILVSTLSFFTLKKNFLEVKEGI